MSRPSRVPPQGSATGNQLRIRSAGARRLRWEIAGLRDAPIRAAAIERAVRGSAGVRKVVANPATGRVRVEFDPPAIDGPGVEKVLTTVMARPFAELASEQEAASPVRSPDHEHDHGHEGDLSGHVVRLLAGGLAFGAILLHKLTLFAPIALPPGVGTALGLGVTIVAGYPFFRGGIRAIARGSTGDTDTLITVATVASIVVNESVTALIVLWLLNLGDLLQAVVLRRTRRAIRELLSVGDREVWVVLPDGQADLRVPVFRNPGERVFAGTVVEAGWSHIRAEQVGDATAVGRLIQRVEAARELQAPIETIGGRFSQRFVPMSFLLAGLVFVLTRDIRRSVTMLVVACPCAAGLATPTAVSASIGSAAQRGVLIKGGVSLECAADVDAVVLDKTGTLTTGRPRVTPVIAVDPDTPPEQLLNLAASGELHSPHPLGLAVVRDTREREMEIPEHETCELLVGRGMCADMHGNRLLVGSQRLLEEFGLVIPPRTPQVSHSLREHGETVLYVGIDERFIGLIGVADVIRPPR